MGVDHGAQRGHVPPEFGVGDDNANCPPQILSYKYKNQRSVAFKYAKIRLGRGTPLGELTTLPRPPSRLKRGHPSPYPTPLGTNPPLALAMRPPEFQPDLRLWFREPNDAMTFFKKHNTCSLRLIACVYYLTQTSKYQKYIVAFQHFSQQNLSDVLEKSSLRGALHIENLQMGLSAFSFATSFP